MSQVVSRPLPLRKLEATYDLLLEGDSTIIYGSQVFPLFQIHTQIILAPSVQPQLHRSQIYNRVIPINSQHRTINICNNQMLYIFQVGIIRELSRYKLS